jgi:hypothetical protein
LPWKIITPAQFIDETALFFKKHTGNKHT